MGGVSNWSQFVTSSSQYIDHVSRFSRYRTTPLPEPAVFIHGLDPNLQERALGFILIGILPLGFEQ